MLDHDRIEHRVRGSLKCRPRAATRNGRIFLSMSRLLLEVRAFRLFNAECRLIIEDSGFLI
jgi:hypothetical protein